ncbi:hypothetical protein P4S70_15105 [Enterovibrio sp. Hal110]
MCKKERPYQYRERNVELDADRAFRFGEGKISGYLSVFLGALSLLAVLAYLFPSYLTTTELRKAYDAESLQQVLKYGMYFSLFFRCNDPFFKEVPSPRMHGHVADIDRVWSWRLHRPRWASRTQIAVTWC